MKRGTGFFFTVEHSKEGEMTHFVLFATCGQCGHSITPDGKLEMIIPLLLEHSLACHFALPGKPCP